MSYYYYEQSDANALKKKNESDKQYLATINELQELTNHYKSQKVTIINDINKTQEAIVQNNEKLYFLKQMDLDLKHNYEKMCEPLDADIYEYKKMDAKRLEEETIEKAKRYDKLEMQIYGCCINCMKKASKNCECLDIREIYLTK